MGKKKKGGKRGFRVGKYANLAFKILGLAVAASPAIRAVSDNVSNPSNIPRAVAYGYSGLDINTGGVTYSQTVAGVLSVIVGMGLAKLGGYLGRRF